MANIIHKTEQFNDSDYWEQFSGITVTPNTHAAPLPGASGADTIVDNSVVTGCSLFGEYETIPNDTSSWTASIFVRKDADTTRFPAFGMQFNGGTQIFPNVSFNTSTGAAEDNDTCDAFGVEDIDANWWRVWFTKANNNTGNTILRFWLYPAPTGVFGGSENADILGTCVVWGANITAGTVLEDYDPSPAYDPANVLNYTEEITNPAWGDIGASPVRTRNTAAAPAFAGASAGQADTVEDDSASQAEGINQNVTPIAADLTDWVASVFVRKDAITSRFPEFTLALDNGTPAYCSVQINTSTGEIANGADGTPDASGVVDFDANWWRVWMRKANNGTNTLVGIGIYPARAASLGGSTDFTVTGSIQIWGANITNSASLLPYDANPAYALPTNILTKTEAFDDTSEWTPQEDGATVTANTHRGPAFAGDIDAGLADTLADASATAQANFISTYKDINDDASEWTLSLYVRKDLVTSRVLSMLLHMNGGTAISGLVLLNTATGETGEAFEGSPPDAFGAEDVDEHWWRLWATLANNHTGNTLIRTILYPANRIGIGEGAGSGLTGSVVVWGANLTNTPTLQAYQPDPAYTFETRGKIVFRKAS